MNRLVIVGNGFDLAHGLPTSYRHFIDDFWKNISDNYKNDIIKEIIYVDESHTPFDYRQINDFDELKKVLNLLNTNYSRGFTFDEVNIELNQGPRNIFKFKNDFFKLINIENSQNWVDIENEYYKELKKIIKNSDSKKGRDKVLKLNKEFDQVKKLLEEYLIKNVNEKYYFGGRPSDIEWAEPHFSPFVRYLEKNKKNSNYLKEFPNKYHQELIDFDNRIIEANNDKTIQDKSNSGDLLQNNYFLNFNYTKTIDAYISSFQHLFTVNQEQIQIHGRLETDNNEINFGFGDEMDDDYKKIENFDDNEYLKYFKSFQYSQNSNYKRLLDYIDSDNFQVYIMGHSCGLSDRTLLNTVFEHKNCRSIKVFYHNRDDGTDNYTEIIQNISRHFNKKVMMREKIVNKSLCVPLVQTVRFNPKN